MKEYNKIRHELNRKLKKSAGRIRSLTMDGRESAKQVIFHQSSQQMTDYNATKIELREILFFVAVLFIAIFISCYELKIIKTHLLIEDMLQQGINYDAFREMKLDEADILKAENKINHLLKDEPMLKDKSYMDGIGYLAFSMMAADYDLLNHSLVDETTFSHGIGEVAVTSCFRELYGYYKAILSDLEYFPVPRVETADISYYDTWYELRNYGGNRRHEGTDLMASNNLRGFFPIISITDGTVEKMGWLEQGGYRIGIRSDSGGYFYYAHLYSYAPDLKIGDQVIAGQLLGFMGDSGYGPEGTTGQFDVHLHLGIYVDSSIGEMSVDPYWILKFMQKYRTAYTVE